MNIDTEIENLRRANEALRLRLEERRQVDSLRRSLRDCETRQEVAERGIVYAEAELGGVPCLLLHEEIARPGFSLGNTVGLASTLIAPGQEVFVERTAELSAALTEGPVVHSPAAPIASLAPFAKVIRTESIVAAGVYESENLVGLLVAPGGDALREAIGVAAEELSSATAAAVRAQARAEELAQREAQELQLVALLEEIEKRDRAFQAELREAREFQQQLVALPPLKGVKVCSFYEPMGLIGGDLLAVSQRGSRIRIFIADATGHGIRASLTTMFIKSGYESFLGLADPSLVLEELNDSIASTYRSSEMLFTAACVDVNTETGEVALASAAHPPACVVRSGEILLLERECAPMGVMCGVKYEKVTTTLSKGDGVYLYTDGIDEARVGPGKFFGETRLHELIRQSHVAEEDVGAKVREELLNFVGQFSLSDDASLIGIRLV